MGGGGEFAGRSSCNHTLERMTQYMLEIVLMNRRVESSRLIDYRCYHAQCAMCTCEFFSAWLTGECDQIPWPARLDCGQGWEGGGGGGGMELPSDW